MDSERSVQNRDDEGKYSNDEDKDSDDDDTNYGKVGDGGGGNDHHNDIYLHICNIDSCTTITKTMNCGDKTNILYETNGMAVRKLAKANQATKALGIVIQRFCCCW